MRLYKETFARTLKLNYKYAKYELNFDNVRILAKKRVLWTRMEATLNRQSSKILTEFRRLR